MLKTGTFSEAIEFKNAETLEELVGFGLDPFEADAHGDFSLNVASEALKLLLVQDLVEAGADVNVTNHAGYTPLLSVIETCHLNPEIACSITEVLLDAGADIEGRGDWDKTPFLKSCTRGIKEITRLLVKRGCNVHATADEIGGPMGAEEFADMPSNSREFRSYISDLCSS